MTRTLLASLVLIGFLATATQADIFGNLGRSAKKASRSFSGTTERAGNTVSRSVKGAQKHVKKVGDNVSGRSNGGLKGMGQSVKNVSQLVNRSGKGIRQTADRVKRDFRNAAVPSKQGFPKGVKGISRDIDRVVKAIGKRPGTKLPKPGIVPLPKPIVKPLPHPIIPPNPVIVPHPGPTPIIPPNPIICPRPFPRPCPTPIVCPLPTPRPCPTPIVCPVPTPVITPLPSPVVDPVVVEAPEPATTIFAGSTLEMAGENVGTGPGTILVKAGPLSLKAKVVRWGHGVIQFHAPEIDITEAVPAKLVIFLADGSEFQNLPILFAPAQDTEPGPDSQLPVVQVGKTMMLDGEFGASQGTVQLTVAGMTVPATVVNWTASRATFATPALELAEEVEAQLTIKRAGGEVASQMAVLLTLANS